MGAFKIIPDGLDKEEFTGAMVQYLDNNNLSGIVFKREDTVMGLGLFWPRERILQTSDLLWFPWASKASIMKSYVNFINEMRETKHPSGHYYLILEFAQEKDEAFFTHICKYGIMRRIGTSHEVHPDEKTLVYESRS